MILDRIRNLDYAILLCEDWERMRAFYRDTLGFSVYRGWDGWCEFRVGSTLLTLRRRGRPYDGPAAEGAAVQLAFSRRACGSRHLLRRARGQRSRNP